MEFDTLLAGISSGDPITVAILAVAGLIVIASLVSGVVSVWLAISYIRYHRKKNSANVTGEQAARQILDANGLQNIKVKCTGSILFGNSYSHYFKKVRLRRMTWKKQSVSSLAMAAQKSSLAVLDQEGDADMKRRVRLVPLITFGPFAFVPLLIVGVVIDLFFFGGLGAVSVIATALGLLFYLFSFVLSLTVLKTEVKAQKRAVEILKQNGMATAEELNDMQELFRLYNIEYVNDMVIALLELIYRILQILARMKSSSAKSNS